MTPEDLPKLDIKVDLTKAADTAADVFGRLAGAPAEEAGSLIGDTIGVLTDKIHAYRKERQVKLYVDVQRKAIAAKKELHAIELPLLKEASESASVEQDENLHQMWSSLLASASTSAVEASTARMFANILKQLTPADAELLQALGSFVEKQMKEAREHAYFFGTYDSLYALARTQMPHRKTDVRFEDEHMPPAGDFMMSIQNLASHQMLDLATPGNVRTEVGEVPRGAATIVYFTNVARRFLEACSFGAAKEHHKFIPETI